MDPIKKRDVSGHGPIPGNEERLRALLENAFDLVMVLGEGGRITYTSPSIRVYEYTPEELLGKIPRDFLHPEDLAMLETALERSIQHPGTPVPVKGIRIFHKNGSWRVMEGVLTCLFDLPAVNGIVFNGRDLTGRIRLEKRLRQTQRLEALGSLAGGIAHDFNNLLGVILGYADLACGQVKEGTRVHRHLWEVFKAGLRARELVDQVLTFSRQAEQERKPTSLVPIFKEAMKFIRSTVPASIKIKTRIQDQDAVILADPIQIHQVIMNLCTNACHAIGEKVGTMEVSLERRLVDSTAASRLDLQAGEYCVISVSDTGDGMSPDILEKIFDPFFTTRDAGEGTGLGLSIVHEITASHAGAVEVESRKGQGTLAGVYFPRMAERTGENIQADRCRTPLPKGRGRILVVEDEAPLLDLMKQQLETLGYEIQATGDPVSALNAFTRMPDRYDAVITDLAMPGMTGTALSRKLLELRPDLPILLSTGHGNRITQERARAMGLARMFRKPVLIKDLARALREILQESPA